MFSIRLSRLARPYSTARTALPKFIFSKAVADALATQKPVVALESTIITHGMPFPQNLETARQVEDIVRSTGATPATIAILDGKVHIGLDNVQLEQLAELGPRVKKTARRDLSFVCSQGISGATTVSSTMMLAHRAGIKMFVTGGIGGVHRGAESTMDISSDLTELGRTPVAVVCAGVKSILDVGRTLEFLETQGVAVATFGADDQFPAFFTKYSGFKSPLACSTIQECSKLIQSNLDLNTNNGVVIAVPIPDDHAADGELVQQAIEKAILELEYSHSLMDDVDRAQRIVGKDVTPFMLKRVNELTQGASLRASTSYLTEPME